SEDWYREYFADPDGRQPFFINEPYPGYVAPNQLKNKPARMAAQASSSTYYPQQSHAFSSTNYQQQTHASSSTYGPQQSQASSSTLSQLPPPAGPRTRRLRQAPPNMGINLSPAEIFGQQQMLDGFITRAEWAAGGWGLADYQDYLDSLPRDFW
ncbi:MAG: hypothetical protein Q9180_009732, partial [Flavoplaca navasiana]